MQPKDITVHPLDRDELMFHRRSLPHWERPDGIYFVTFRLADSVPKPVIDAYVEESGIDEDIFEKESLRLYCARIDRHIDVGIGARWLSRPEVARIVAGAPKHFGRDRYDLFRWTVMPNHVQVVFRPLETNPGAVESSDRQARRGLATRLVRPPRPIEPRSRAVLPVCTRKPEEGRADRVALAMGGRRTIDVLRHRLGAGGTKGGRCRLGSRRYIIMRP